MYKPTILINSNPCRAFTLLCGLLLLMDKTVPSINNTASHYLKFFNPIRMKPLRDTIDTLSRKYVKLSTNNFVARPPLPPEACPCTGGWEGGVPVGRNQNTGRVTVYIADLLCDGRYRVYSYCFVLNYADMLSASEHLITVIFYLFYAGFWYNLIVRKKVLIFLLNLLKNLFIKKREFFVWLCKSSFLKQRKGGNFKHFRSINKICVSNVGIDMKVLCSTYYKVILNIFKNRDGLYYLTFNFRHCNPNLISFEPSLLLLSPLLKGEHSVFCAVYKTVSRILLFLKWRAL